MSEWQPAINLINFFVKPSWWDFAQPQDAHAPPLYDYDQYGNIKPSGGRTPFLGEQQFIDDYNNMVGQLNHVKQLALSNFMKSNLPLSGAGDDLINDWSDALSNAEQTRSPLVLDLNGDGVKTTQLSHSFTKGAHFNLDAKGFAENTGWVSKEDGLLVRDLDGDGKISSGRELFGDHTLLKNGQVAANGFEALKEIDDNGDGVLNSADAAFNTLLVWKDLNGNGSTEEGELLTLAQAGVQSLNVGYTNSNTTDAEGNQHQQVGSFTKTDGSTQTMEDVWFAVDNARSSASETVVDISPEIAALPELAHIGNLPSLHQAMAQDESGKLKELMEQYIDEGFGDKRDALLQDILYHWAGVQDVAQLHSEYSREPQGTLSAVNENWRLAA